ncbi:MAG: hypothetical protein CSA42_03810 [Gammaproteobacteria bacterium]|nr:MAG: hypothetical protein CSA42_03810 [Gammaproteobacteria bacterium]
MMSKLSKFVKSPLISVADSIYKHSSKDVVKPVPAKKPAAKKPAAKKPAAKKPAVTQNRMFDNIRLRDEVALYFDGGLGNLYQIEQWLGPLQALSKVKTFIFVVRNKYIFEWIRKNTDFQVVYCRLIDNVMQVFEQGEFKCVLYVNHAQKNFQSLITRDAFHVHINHGESDKLSTVSNQTKAYDYVLLVGPAAYDKYHNNLLNKDMSRYIQIGRPQLEYIAKVKKPITDRQDPANAQENLMFANAEVVNRHVVLYAPTWESTHESMNYTSLQNFGLSLVDAILEDPDLYLIYKPHPNTGSRVVEVKKINAEIIKRLQGHYKAEVVLDGDINSLYEHVDLAIFDNSAVAIDYLAVEKPMLMMDMFDKLSDRNDKPFITNAATMISEDNFVDVLQIIHQEIEHDTVAKRRAKVKNYFLGDVDYANNESTRNFVEMIKMICDERDAAVEALADDQISHEPVFEESDYIQIEDNISCEDFSCDDVADETDIVSETGITEELVQDK